MRAFVFANRGHGSTAIRAMQRLGVEVAGVCGTAPPVRFDVLKERLLRTLVPDGWPYGDPFDGFEEPANLGVPFHDCRTMPDPGAVDMILVCGFPKLVPLYEGIPSFNIHPGLLPERPGGTPNRWAVRCGDKQTGVTVHRLSDRFDAGEILWRKEIEIQNGSDWGQVEHSLTPLIELAVKAVLEHDFDPRPNPVTKTQPSLRGQHVKVDWANDPHSIRRQCLAMRPKTGAATTWRGRPLVLWNVVPHRYEGPEHRGTIINIDDDGCPLVTAGNATLSIDQVLRNGRIVEANDLNFKLGEQLG
jgi:methionyl-tRNA formyltransferase